MLEQADVDHFMDEVEIECTGTSRGGIKTALYTVLDEFFQDSLSWRESIHLNVTAGIQNYKILVRDGGRPIVFMGCWDGYRLGVAAFMPHFGELHVRQPIQTTSIPVATTNPPTPQALAATNPWLIMVAETVKKPETREGLPVAPAWVLQVYFRTILDGVIGKLQAQPSKSYSNQSSATYHLKRFRQGIQIARTAAARENSFGAQTWRYPMGWESRTQRAGMVSYFPPPSRF